VLPFPQPPNFDLDDITGRGLLRPDPASKLAKEAEGPEWLLHLAISSIALQQPVIIA